MIINYLKRRLNTKQRRKIRKLFVDLTYPVLRYDLSTLAKYCGTDKSGFHEYTSLYESHFANLKNKNIKIFLISKTAIMQKFDNKYTGWLDLGISIRYDINSSKITKNRGLIKRRQTIIK